MALVLRSREAGGVMSEFAASVELIAENGGETGVRLTKTVSARDQAQGEAQGLLRQR